MNKYFDFGTIIVIVVTMILFVLALFVKGLTKDILLEAGVLLVSIKLIYNAYRTNQYYNNLQKDIDDIKELLKNKK